MYVRIPLSAVVVPDTVSQPTDFGLLGFRVRVKDRVVFAGGTGDMPWSLNFKVWH